MVVAINPIHKAAGIKRVIVSTYQAVSGAGINGLRELTDHTRAYLSGYENPTPEVFQYPIAFNIIPHIDNFVQDDYTREEMKMVWETQKIMHAPALKIAPTAVRVPVFRSHCEAIYLETEQPLSAAQATFVSDWVVALTVKLAFAHTLPLRFPSVVSQPTQIGRASCRERV